MPGFIDFILKWSEVWPWLIPLTIYLVFLRQKDRYLALTILSGFAIVLTFIGSYIGYYRGTLPKFLQNNLVFYNILSVLRALILGWFIINLPQLKIYRFIKVLYVLFIAALLINFIALESFLNFSHRLFTAESILLLMLCITYFLGTILDEEVELSAFHPDFLICTGISLFAATNFFIYLFFEALIKLDIDFGFATMQISKYSNILIGIFFGLALFQHNKITKPKLKLSQS